MYIKIVKININKNNKNLKFGKKKLYYNILKKKKKKI